MINVKVIRIYLGLFLMGWLSFEINFHVFFTKKNFVNRSTNKEGKKTSKIVLKIENRFFCWIFVFFRNVIDTGCFVVTKSRPKPNCFHYFQFELIGIDFEMIWILFFFRFAVNNFVVIHLFFFRAHLKYGLII